jgi:energy-coupling factor transport system permease protein
LVKHAGLRISLLMLLAAVLPIASLSALCVLVGSLALLIWQSDLTIKAWLSGLLRLRWLFISIAILYCWFTPGSSLPAPDIFPIPLNMPSYLGVQISAERSLVLAVLFGSVLLCLEPLKPENIVAGLRWLLYPLSLLGLPIILFCRRLASTLASINTLQQVLRAEQSNDEQPSAAAWMETITERGARAIRMVEATAISEAAESTVDAEVILPSAAMAETAVVVAIGSFLLAIVICL